MSHAELVELVVSHLPRMQVPVPVIVMEPTEYSLPALLAAGSTDIFLTNVGLIAGNAVMLTLPSAAVRADTRTESATCANRANGT